MNANWKKILAAGGAGTGLAACLLLTGCADTGGYYETGYYAPGYYGPGYWDDGGPDVYVNGYYGRYHDHDHDHDHGGWDRDHGHDHDFTHRGAESRSDAGVRNLRDYRGPHPTQTPRGTVPGPGAVHGNGGPPPGGAPHGGGGDEHHH